MPRRLLLLCSLLTACGGAEVVADEPPPPNVYEGTLVVRRGEEVLEEIALANAADGTRPLGPGGVCELTVRTDTLRSGALYPQVQVRCQLEGGVAGMGGHCVTAEPTPPHRPPLAVRPADGGEPFEVALLCGRP